MPLIGDILEPKTFRLTGNSRMTTSEQPVDITENDIRLLLHFRLDAEFLAMLLEDAGVSLSVPIPDRQRRHEKTTPLTPREIELLEAAGARLERTKDASTKEKAQSRVSELVYDCRSLMKNSIPADKAAAVLGASEAELMAWATSKPAKIHGFTTPEGQWLFPQWQFTNNGTIPHLEALLKHLSEYPCPISINWFMTTPNRDLEYRDEEISPRDWLMKGLETWTVEAFFYDGL